MNRNRIRILRHEAEEHGDLKLAALCCLALWGRAVLEGAELGTELDLLAERVDRGELTQEDAIRLCEEAIAAGIG